MSRGADAATKQSTHKVKLVKKNLVQFYMVSSSAPLGTQSLQD